MLDAVVGAVIMVVAATSLFLAVETVEDGFRAAGRYPLSSQEEKLLDDLSQSMSSDQSALIDGVRLQVPEQLPRYLDDTP